MKHEIFIEKVAQICHEVNSAYCMSQGDFSQDEWEEAPDWQRASARNGVAFHMQGDMKSPQASHENWLQEKELDGWEYGDVKDFELKTHPCMLPYEDLPREQKAKDFIFRAIVETCKEVL